jgi:hypothetical protein
MKYSANDLDYADVEAIVKSRVMRKLPQNIKLWSWVGLVLVIGGCIYSVTGGGWFGFAVAVVGIGAYWYYSKKINTATKSMMAKLKDEWRAGQ